MGLPCDRGPFQGSLPDPGWTVDQPTVVVIPTLQAQLNAMQADNERLQANFDRLLGDLVAAQIPFTTQPMNTNQLDMVWSPHRLF
jgi:hypothetical protein